MKGYKLLGLSVCLLLSACEIADNVDPKAPVSASAESIFSNALRNSLAHIDNMDQNINVSRLLCQYNSQVHYVDPSRYQFEDRQIPDGYWSMAYLTLRDLTEVKSLLSEEQPGGRDPFFRNRANKMAITDLVEVLMYHNLVDFFGDVPYSEAMCGRENITPAYDDARSIYNDLLDRLSSDIEIMTTGANAGSWGAEDLVYGGEVDMWRKFAATLKLRLGMRLADVDPEKAQLCVSEALASGCLEAGESMQLRWIGILPHVNTIYQLFIVNARNDFAPSNTIIDLMEAMGDARMAAYFTQVNISQVPDEEIWAYVGIPYGFLSGGMSYINYSHFGDSMFDPDFPTTVTCHAEVEFLLAEAAARGMTVDGTTAREHYEAGIAESHNFWGVAMDPAYLTHPNVAWNASRARELIGTQKWIALYNRGNEGYAVFRCFDWPVLTSPNDMNYQDIPMRMPYPYNEPDLNGTNYQDAADAIGGDDVRTLLFWDTSISTEHPPAGF